MNCCSVSPPSLARLFRSSGLSGERPSGRRPPPTFQTFGSEAGQPQSGRHPSRSLVERRRSSRYALRVDFSAILILPYSAVVTVVVLAAALLLKLERPRLIWPCAFATITAAAVFVGLPRSSDFGLWLAGLLGLSLWAAFGAVIGMVIVKLSMATIRAFSGE